MSRCENPSQRSSQPGRNGRLLSAWILHVAALYMVLSQIVQSKSYYHHGNVPDLGNVEHILGRWIPCSSGARMETVDVRKILPVKYATCKDTVLSSAFRRMQWHTARHASMSGNG